MNILDFLILAILGFCVLAGMYKGFLTSCLSTIGFVLSWIGAGAVYPKVANLALSNTTLMNVLNQYLEPNSFFESTQQALKTVTEVVSGGEAAIQQAISTVTGKIPVIASAFENNIRNQSFAKLNINTLSDYLDQTIWQAVFSVIGFLLAFFVIYAVVSLVINLLDHVIRFPVLRMFDWLVGGIFGLVKGIAFSVLIITLLPTVVSLLSPELSGTLMNGSVMYNIVRQLDFVGVAHTIMGLIG